MPAFFITLPNRTRFRKQVTDYFKAKVINKKVEAQLILTNVEIN